MLEALPLAGVSVRRLGDDLVIEGRPDRAAAAAAQRAARRHSRGPIRPGQRNSGGRRMRADVR